MMLKVNKRIVLLVLNLFNFLVYYNSIYLFLYASMLLLGASVFLLLDILNNNLYRFNFFIITAFSIGFFSATGVTTAVWMMNSIGVLNEFLQNMQFSIKSLTHALVLIHLFCYSLELVGRFWAKNKLSTIERIDITAFLDRNRKTGINSVLFVIVLGQLYLSMAGYVAFGGKFSDATSFNEGFIFTYIFTFFPFVPIVCGYYLKVFSVRRNYQLAFLYLVIILFEIYWLFHFGRRFLIFCLILILLGFFFNQKITLRFVLKRILPLSLILYMFIGISNYFQKIRFAFGDYDLIREASISQIIETVNDFTAQSDVSYLLKENIAYRSGSSPFFLAKLIELEHKQDTPYFYGEHLYDNLMVIMPSNFIVDKSKLLLKEDLYNATYKTDFLDESESLFTEAYSDFGIWGVVLIYPLCFFCLFYLFFHFLRKLQLHYSYLLLITAQLFNAFFSIESNFSGLIIVFRNVLLVVIIEIIIKAFAENQAKKMLTVK